MKDRTLAIVAFAISIAALSYCGWLHRHSQAMAIEALRQRESELVRNATPRFRDLYADMMMGSSAFNGGGFNPTTLEELLRPAGEIAKRMAGGSDETEVAPVKPEAK